MIKDNSPDYSILDRPDVLMNLFHPRTEMATIGEPKDSLDLLIPVEADIHVGARFHVKDKACPNILFFHGNGEIVADYDDLGTMYNQLDINFLAVDYRGYGRSNGTPTVSAMMGDCEIIFSFVYQWLQDYEYSGPLVVMGRSLGSASALELIQNHKTDINALIIESGFALAGPLMKLLGIDPNALGYNEENGFNHIEKIKTFEKPTLIIHAEYDHIIPFSDGQALYDASPALNKSLLKIPGANHNDIFFRGIKEYLTAIRTLLTGL